VPASPTDRHLAAAKFAEEWAGRGQEDMHDQTFWNQFLGEVMGVARVHHEIDYQKRVTIPHHGTKRIDAYIPASKVLIEQKSQHVDLKAAHHDLAVLMVRLLFCLYAEDSGLFDPGAFSSYLQVHAADITAFRYALINIFAVLDTPPERRAANLDFDEALVQLPYVNGGLFAEDIVLPQLTAEIRLELIVNCARAFDWSQISPVIFGSIFESILSGDERRAGGMHYTSPANIHKVIDPLFLDELRSELNAAGHNKAKLLALQDKMASLKFLDPACGSGKWSGYYCVSSYGAGL